VIDRSAPIGVFDSGLGGLTVARELMRQLPDESLVYFGDTARVPYGPKSPGTVRRYSREVSAFLRDQGVKAIVIACNTATAHALASLRAELPIPIVGVVDPGATAAVQASPTKRIGVIGTAGTIRSGAYGRAIREKAPSAEITARACPLFVPFVEEGWIEHPSLRLVASEYLAPFQGAKVDTLVLGCTHYPLLKRVIGETVGRPVTLIDSAEETAAELGRVLRENHLVAGPGNLPSYRFVASDDPRQFVAIAERFLGRPIDSVELRTLG
jgi:glutamate racemase